MSQNSRKTGWFANDRFGMFIHWGLYSLSGLKEWIQSYDCSSERYQKYFDHFNPDRFDPEAWARQAKKTGMKYVVITTKHHDGFCLWDTRTTDYRATQTPCGRDLLKEIVNAFRKEGIKIGLYYSLLDWHHKDYIVDWLHPLRNDPEEYKKNSKRQMKRYEEYMRKHMTELLTHYGKIDILWFDGSYPEEKGKARGNWEVEKLVKLIRKLQPAILINNRLDFPESADFTTPEQIHLEKPLTDSQGIPLVWEACHTFSGSWGYHRDESTWKSVTQLLYLLIDSASKGGNTLLNVGPTAQGDFDYRAKERLDGMAEWMQYHGKSIYGCEPAPHGVTAPQDYRYTFNPKTNRLYLHVLSWPTNNQPFQKSFRKIDFGCRPTPEKDISPPNSQYIYDSKDGRLYLHIMVWPFTQIQCPGLAGRVEYAQLLHDASEIRFINEENGTLTLTVPNDKPKVEIPVIELFLKQDESHKRRPSK
jgi:alpha-L-fucosidase